MRNLLTKKQEDFTVNLFKGMTQREAWIQAGYSSNKYTMAKIDSKACELANSGKVKGRLQELRDEAATPTVMTVQERQERLSEIIKARITDYQELGADGSYITIGKESPNTGAIQEIVSRTEYDENTAKAAVISRVKLHDPIRAIAEMNKMDGSYAPEKHAVLGNIVIEVVYENKQLAKG